MSQYASCFVNYFVSCVKNSTYSSFPIICHYQNHLLILILSIRNIIFLFYYMYFLLYYVYFLTIFDCLNQCKLTHNPIILRNSHLTSLCICEFLLLISIESVLHFLIIPVLIYPVQFVQNIFFCTLF